MRAKNFGFHFNNRNALVHGECWFLRIKAFGHGLSIKRVTSDYVPLFSERYRQGVRRIGPFYIRRLRPAPRRTMEP